MRVLITSTPGHGHRLPLVGIAQAIRDRGHAVLWATAGDVAPQVTEAGLDAVAAGLTAADLALARQAVRGAMPVLRPDQIGAYVFPRLFGAALAAAMLDDLLPVARNWAPDLMVHEQAELAAPLVANLLGVPHLTHGFGAVTPAATVTEAGTMVARMWEEHGREAPAFAGCYQHGYLDIWPTALGGGPEPQLGKVRPLRPTDSSSGEGEWSLPTRWAADDDRPLVYLTMGTVHRATRLLGDLLAGLSGLDVRILVTVGQHVDPDLLGGASEQVAVEQYVPQGPVLRTCAAVVCHGGAGTVLGAAAAGVPMVCLPQAADQFRNSEGVATSGAGLVLHPDQVTASSVTEAVRAVLGDPGHRSAADWVRDEIAAMPTPDEVAGQLERLA
jgi:UDP:flavonoid glycosyltransferase YjiC (YdhE family)